MRADYLDRSDQARILREILAIFEEHAPAQGFRPSQKMREAMEAGASALEQAPGTWLPIASAPKHTPILFLFEDPDTGGYFQEVGQRLEDAPNGGRMRFAEANMNPGHEPEAMTSPSMWQPLPAPPLDPEGR